MAFRRQPRVAHTVHCTSHSYGLAWCFEVPIYLWQQEEGKRIGVGSGRAPGSASSRGAGGHGVFTLSSPHPDLDYIKKNACVLKGREKED